MLETVTTRKGYLKWKSVPKFSKKRVFTNSIMNKRLKITKAIYIGCEIGDMIHSTELLRLNLIRKARSPYTDRMIITRRCQHLRSPMIPTHTVHSH